MDKIRNLRFRHRRLVKLLIFLMLVLLLMQMFNMTRNNYIFIFSSMNKELASFKDLRLVNRTYREKSLNYTTLRQIPLAGQVYRSPVPKSVNFSFGEECLNSSNVNQIQASNFSNEDFSFLKTEKGKNYKKILFYFHNEIKHYWFGYGHKPFEVACCKEKRCFTTAKKDEIPIEDFDAVMIHFQQFSFKKLPKKRSKHQRYIFYEKEPVTYSSKNPQDYEGIFNWTMTYRMDSDIYVRYGEIHPKSDFSLEGLSHYDNTIEPIEPLMKTKKKMAAWMSSEHCRTPSKREDYVKEMQKYIPVDIYGKCGSLKCDRKQMEKCHKMIEENYKFYFSFENNHCKDYITEKFFTLLTYNVIPVVRGAGDYASIAPPHSYIDVRDFKSPKELANYLVYLDKNDTAYMEYFKWKPNYIIFPAAWFSQAISYCDLCERLHSDKEEKIHYDLREWFVEKAKCNKDLVIHKKEEKR